MTRRTIASLLVAPLLLALPLAACGDDDDASGDDAGTTTTEEQQDESTTTTEEEPALDPAEAVLTVEDMPAGYTEEPDEDDDDEDSPTQACPRLEALEGDEEPLEEASANFQAGENGPFVTHEVAVLQEGRAEEAIESFRGALDDPACRTFTQPTDNGGTATFTLTEIPVPQLGDDVVGLRLTGDAAALGAQFDAILERVGDVGSYIAVITIPGLSGPPPALDQLATRADEKVQAAL